MEETMANLMCDFMVNTVKGYESGIYKSFTSNNKNHEQLRSNNIKFLLIKFNIDYHNKLYRSLILKDDQYVIEELGKIHNTMNHSYICLLNILCKFTTDLITNRDRSLMNVDSYEKYMDSVCWHLEMWKSTLMKTLPSTLSHTCSGDDIATCNPDQPLFFMKT